MRSSKKEYAQYQKLEKVLSAFFRLFGGLCAECYSASLRRLSKSGKPDFTTLCCCMVDDQVRDYHTLLSRAQEAIMGPRWTKQLPELRVTSACGRKGPCAALTATGCALRSMRPPTCSTQLCDTMVDILFELGLANKTEGKPAQIEDIIGIPSPFDQLYGVRQGVARERVVEAYEAQIRSFTKKLADIPEVQRNSIIASALKIRIERMERGSSK